MLIGDTVFPVCLILPSPIDIALLCEYNSPDDTNVLSTGTIIVRLDSDVKMKGKHEDVYCVEKGHHFAAIVIVAAVLGRLAVRAFLNLLLGGTLFGGNFL